MTTIAVAVAAAAGAIVRSRLARHGWRGTLAVNAIGSFVLGCLVGRWPDGDVAVVLGVGFCGALTTFGTFALEVVTAPHRRGVTIAVTNVVGCVALASLGFAVSG
jgi:CrcB protein